MKNKKGLVSGLIILVIIAVVFLWRASESDWRRFAFRDQEPAIAKLSSGAAAPTQALVVQYASPPPKIAPPQPEPAVAKGEALVELPGRLLKPENYSGQFQRIAIGPTETVPIRLSWPGDTSHSDVFVQAVHGGKIDGESNHKRFQLGDDKTVSFTFTPEGGPGTYQIALRRGTIEEALQFWVPTDKPENDPPTIR